MAVAPPINQITPIHELHMASFQEKTPLVSPVTSIEGILAAWASFQELKLKLLNDTDFVEIKGDKFAKKSAFRKLALAFGISVEIVREDHLDFRDESIAYLMTARATSPNGRSMSACASAHSNEKKFSKVSDARAVAQTRATNRCIADLIGWSAPSAEEMVGEAEPAIPTPHHPSPSNEPHERPPELNNGMTERQRALLVSLINQKVVEPEEREDALRVMEMYSKEDASDVISSFLSQPA